MTKKISAYEALAAHLSADDPIEGARQIDAAILSLQRARHLPRNCARATFLLGNLVLSLGVAVLVARVSCWIEGDLRFTFMGTIANMAPVWVAALLVVAGLGLQAMYWSFDGDEYGPRPLPPAPIYEWLVANGKSDLRYWHEIYWPYPKVLAHRKEALGFVFWRKSLRPVDQYPSIRVAVPVKSDPHLEYLAGARGQADQRAYLIEFEHRMDDWNRLFFKVTIAVLAVLGTLVWLPIYPPAQEGRFLRTGVMFAFIAVCLLRAFGVGTIPMRWLPAPVRRYWFRSLPPEAGRFRDHMIALSD